MPKTTKQFEPFVQRMQQAGLPDIAIQTFAHYYQQLINGQTGLISEKDISPVDSLPDAETLSERFMEVGQEALSGTILLKLNGGLGTSMGLAQAKSLLTVKDGYSFLDIIATQAIKANIPLVLMNSFSTQADSLVALQKYEQLQGRIPLDFLQHKVPKITQANFSPVNWPQDSELEWCPPGHGDIYTALVTSGMLDTLLDAGYAYAFVSNADNLGAVIDPAILGYFAHGQIPFMMEVADRTEADKKGGHLAEQHGRFVLRESAQCPEDEVHLFQDIARYKYFNTNNLWLNLPALKQIMIENDYVLRLPMIRNAKTVDPRNSASTPVYQLESAMGAAIATFTEAQAIRVPRTRFAPVKTTNDLLAVRSDAYLLTDNFHIIANPERILPHSIINLDPTYYKLTSDFEARFPVGVPSLVECTHFSIKGDIKFEANVAAKGNIALVNEQAAQQIVKQGTVLSG